MTEHYDVIVVGSGAGGGTLAYALAPTGLKVLLLERGGWLPREAENWSPAAVWAQGHYHNSGKWTDQDGRQFSPKQHYYVGGNTKMYGAILFRFRERDFGAIQHVDGVSPAWPISYADLEPWYTRAEQLYQVHGTRGSDPTEPPAKTPYPFPAISDEPRIAQLSADLARAGLHPFPLPNGILLDEANPRTSKCVRCATCDGFPCLVNGKADAQVICVEPALQYPNVTLLTNAYVSRLDTDRTGRSVTRVVVEREGGVEMYSADTVVVAAGAINSAALLLRSADDKHPHGLGNSSGHVGRHLMLHNNSSLIAFSHDPNPTKFQKTLGINDYYFGADDFPFPLGHIQMLGKTDGDILKAGGAAPLVPGFTLDRIARHAVDFWLTTEDLPDRRNRVTLGRDGRTELHYAITNLESHRRLLAKLSGLLDDLDMHPHLIRRRVVRDQRIGIAGVSHQCGTVRFGADPATSALDTNCKAHDLDNLYVVDTSFFPSSAAVNPALTAMANALRVGDHLLERLDAHAAPVVARSRS
jgi:choline dehydrogenase-like flavoprotein